MSDPDAPDEWEDSDGHETIVCSVCGIPTRVIPCPDHQPRTYAAWAEEQIARGER